MGTGIGVCLEKQSHLTGAFLEVVEALRHTHPDLGLSLCNRIAKAHGGAMDVTSSVSEGTTFSARLPIA